VLLRPNREIFCDFFGGANVPHPIARLAKGRAPKFSINFEEILSRSHGNFKKQNKVLEPSIIIINYFIIIIIIIIIIIKGLLEACDKE
jgi:hypothetical protein